MGQPCKVCAHPARGEIDRRLSFQVVNVAEVARAYGVPRPSVVKHRARHTPAFLPAFQARADALTLGALAAEAQRLYLVTLDALARAEAGALVDVTKDGEPVLEVSHTAIARYIREARQGLGLLAKLSADAAPSNERPAGIANGELDARISDALGQVMQRAIDKRNMGTMGTIEASPTTPIDPMQTTALEGISPSPGPPIASGATPERVCGAATPPGATRASAPTPPPSNSPDSAPHQIEIPGDKPDIRSVPWTGNHAASKEERAEAGYVDIPLDIHEHSDPILEASIAHATARWAEHLRDEERREKFDDPSEV